jgi:hypothetical protein
MKQPPRQNLENKETTKIVPAKETKQHPKNQENLRTTQPYDLLALSYTSKKL